MSSERRPSGDPFEIDPYTPREIFFHLVGATLNALIWVAALVWLALRWSQDSPSVIWVLTAVVGGIYLADLASGILHWAFDTWFDADITFLRRMVLQVREHHIHPGRIFQISFAHDAGTLSWIAFLLFLPIFGWALLSGSLLASYAVLTMVVFDPLLVFMLEFHKCGHRPCSPAWVKALQKMRLVLPVQHHLRHHSGNHDINYCIINGWADLTLGRLGFFRGLEWAIERSTGEQPQRDDHAWFRRFGRRVGGRTNQRPSR